MSGLLIRADASSRVGTGHVMRCLALAAPWLRAKVPVTLAAAELPIPLSEKVEEAGVRICKIDSPAGSGNDAEAIAHLAADASIVVVDGYQFDADFQRAVKDAGSPLLWIDDFGHAADYCADFVLNQNASADPSLYAKREAGTELLLGPRYALLREDFQVWREWQREIPRVASRFLITLGGSDPDDVASRVTAALRRLAKGGRDFQATLVAGGSNPHFSRLEAEARALPWLILLRSTDEMARLMAEADLAITAAGTTVWETCFMGLPSLVAVLAENQRENAMTLAEKGIAGNLGWHGELEADSLANEIAGLADDRSRRETMSRGGRALVDGRGAFRVRLRVAGREIAFRPATASDSRMLWEWINDPAVRAASFTSTPIPWSEHEEWFRQHSQRQDRMIWIGEVNGAPLGQVRFALDDAEAVISVSLAPERRGQAWGSLLIGVGCRRFFESSPVEQITALIKPENRLSIRAFEQAGFVKSGTREVKGAQAVSYRLDRRTAEA